MLKKTQRNRVSPYKIGSNKILSKKTILRLATLLVAGICYLGYSSSTKSSALDIKVVKVIDGDTVKLANGKLLRYIGIDTPEMRLKEEDAFVLSPQPWAKEATDFNRKLVEGKTVHIEFDIEKNDRYGRLLGYCYVANDFINGKLVEEGFAVIYSNPPNIKYSDLLYNLQKEARGNKRGLWGSYEVIDCQDAGNYINQIRTVRGRVVSSYKSDKAVFLYFSKTNKKDFLKVVIFNKALKYFAAKNIEPSSFYKDKTIEVSGRIRDYKGPEIIVSSPYEIETDLS